MKRMHRFETHDDRIDIGISDEETLEESSSEQGRKGLSTDKGDIVVESSGQSGDCIWKRV